METKLFKMNLPQKQANFVIERFQVQVLKKLAAAKNL